MEREFNFPVEPYDVQLDFMNNLHNCLSNCKVGIFESPTGTGKSLSLICSSFKWLRENKFQGKNEEIFEGNLSWLNEVPIPEPSVLADIKNLPDKLQKLKNDVNDEIAAQIPIKIIYISRTHSQLDQCANEIKKTIWADDIKVNPELSSFKSRGIIDYKCKELIDTTINSSCPYFKGQNNLKNHALKKVCDIEDLVVYGKAQKSCPFFATRTAIPQAEVILAPYTLILNKRNRESIGIDLTNNILLIDEAHNIIEAMIDCYSANLSKVQAESSLSAINNYFERFSAKLGAKSVMYFEHVLTILRGIINFMNAKCSNVKNSTSINIGDFLIEVGVERMKFFKK